MSVDLIGLMAANDPCQGSGCLNSIAIALRAEGPIVNRPDHKVGIGE